MDFTLLLAFSSFIPIIIASVSGDEAIDYFTVCSQPFDCGNRTNLSYPFWATDHRRRECGHPDFELIGCGNRNQHPVLVVTESLHLRLSAVNQSSKTLTVALPDYRYTACPRINATLSSTLLAPSPLEAAALQNLTLFFGCPSGAGIPDTRLSCSVAGDLVSFYANETVVRDMGLGGLFESCTGGVVFPIPAGVDGGIWGRDGEAQLQRVLDSGVNLSYSYGGYQVLCEQCGESGGLCGTAAGGSSLLIQ